MKLIYSHLKTFLPDLNVEPQKLRDDLTMIGHFTNFYEEIENEIVFDLDIKVNRGDCLGYYGIARDLSVFYNLKLVNPNSDNQLVTSDYSLPITVTTPKVTRVMAQKLSEIKNSVSPQWLSKFVRLHGVNSINTVVDLTNYIMFLYGLPNHAFDIKKSGENLVWQINPGYSEFTSLDGSKLTLDKSILMINNPSSPLSLSFWGGESCAIDQSTTDIIVEVAIYDRATVRQNSRQLKSVTEASIRLEKDLDPELIPEAFNHLINLLTKHCQAKITSSIFDYYPNAPISPKIEFDLNSPSVISGIDIPTDFVKNALINLGCEMTSLQEFVPPSIRKDISLPQDLAEEVIRFWGYNKIPTNTPISVKQLPDITPKVLYLVEEIKDKLIALGYDEVLSWPLVQKPLSDKAIFTQNSINSDYPVLRESIIQSLQNQLDSYTRYKLPKPQFFEIGKIFANIDGKYQEKYALGIYHYDSKQLTKDLTELNFLTQESNFVEVIIDDLPQISSYVPKEIDNNAIELTSQIITLDANVTINNPIEPEKLVEKYSQLIGHDILWSMEITDIYENRYTFRVCYFNCDDKTAKKIHLQAFDLI